MDPRSALDHCWESPCDEHSVLEWDSMGRHPLVVDGPSWGGADHHPLLPRHEGPLGRYIQGACRQIHRPHVTDVPAVLSVTTLTTTEETRQLLRDVAYDDTVNTLWTTSFCVSLSAL